MKSTDVSEDVVRRVIESLGFPQERVAAAIHRLLHGNNGQDSDSRVLPAILSSQDVQRVLGVSKSTLRRILAHGSLKPVRITPGRIGFLSADVSAYIESCASRRNSEPESTTSRT